MQKNLFSIVEEIIMELFQLIENSENQRLKTSLLEPQQQIYESIKILKVYHEEQEIVNFIQEQFLKLLQIAKTDNNLLVCQEKKWVAFKNKKFIIQDRFIESIIYIAKIMTDQCNTYSVTHTQYLQQECICLHTSQLITIQFYIDNQPTCITFVAPKIIETNLYLVDVELQKLLQKIPNLEERLNYTEKNQQILKLCFDQSSTTLKFWSNNDILSYQLNNRKSKQQENDINYKIYLDVGMKIKLSPNHSLIIQDLNSEVNQQDDLKDEIQPIYLQKDNQNQNQNYIKISNGNQVVVLSLPLNSIMQLRTKLEIPKEVDVTIIHDNKGYYMEIESQNSVYLPQLLSQRTQDRQLQFKSKNLNFVLGFIILEYTNIIMKIDMQAIWNGEGLFEI